MHCAKFPPSNARTAPAYEPGSWPSADLEPQSTSRRQWMIGVCCLVAGATVSWGLSASGSARAGTSAPAQPGATVDPDPDAGVPAWILELPECSDEELMRLHFEVERWSARHRDFERLAPTFERILNLVLESKASPAVDGAGASAARSLDRLGHGDSVALLRRKVAERRDLPETNAAVDAILEARAARKLERK